MVDTYDTPPNRRRSAPATPSKPWLMIWFRCCNTYGRIYRNRAQTAYQGRCPHCGSSVSAKIGPGGTSQRMFTAS